jgi:hypothetical protein
MLLLLSRPLWLIPSALPKRNSEAGRGPEKENEHPSPRCPTWGLDVNNIVPTAPTQTPATDVQDDDSDDEVDLQPAQLPSALPPVPVAAMPLVPPAAAMLPGEFVTVVMAHDSRPDEPATIQEALASPAAECWQQAMTEELQLLHANKTWELVPPSPWLVASTLLQVTPRPLGSLQAHLGGCRAP